MKPRMHTKHAYNLDVISLVIERDERAHHSLQDWPEEEGKEKGEIHDVTSDGRRKKNECQTVPVHTAKKVRRENGF